MKEKKEKIKEEREIDPLEQKVEELTKEVATWKDKAYRTVADCDNLRKSYEKDHQLMVKYRGQPFVEKMLPTLDSFYLVLKIEPEEPLLKNYLVGFQMIYSSMLEALNSEGVNQILPNIGDEFDHNTMQAVDIREGEVDNIIVEISKPGYMLRDRLVRPAMVVVSKVKKEETEKEEVIEETVENTEKDIEKGE